MDIEAGLASDLVVGNAACVGDQSRRPKSVTILECYRRAAEARRIADATTDWCEKFDFFQIERGWLAQAGNIRAKSSKRPPAKTRARKK